MNVLFFGTLIIYFIAMLLQFASVAFHKESIGKAAWYTFVVGVAMHFLYLVVRGIAAHRLPLSNQFEFACAFSWMIGCMLIILQIRMKANWLKTIAIPVTFLIFSYAALQPKEITDLMPALRSAWFGLHIGTAAIAYSSFVLAGCAGLWHILASRNEKNKNAAKLEQTDYLSYRLIALGFLMLTVTILSGAIWAEQAWSAFWTWDPKEVWALITWIIYAIYLHLRLRGKKQGRLMAWYAVIAVPVVLFTFAGVNTLMSGLHSYA